VDRLADFILHMQNRTGRVITAVRQLPDDPLSVVSCGRVAKQAQAMPIIVRMIWRVNDEIITRHGQRVRSKPSPRFALNQNLPLRFSKPATPGQDPHIRSLTQR